MGGGILVNMADCKEYQGCGGWFNNAKKRKTVMEVEELQELQEVELVEDGVCPSAQFNTPLDLVPSTGLRENSWQLNGVEPTDPDESSLIEAMPDVGERRDSDPKQFSPQTRSTCSMT